MAQNKVSAISLIICLIYKPTMGISILSPYNMGHMGHILEKNKFL